MMTDQQKHEVESLRKQGLSYRQIAEKVCVTPACIKTYFHRKRIRDATRLCEQCHKPIITTVNRSNRRFCSTECKSRWWYEYRTGRVVQPKKIKAPASPVSVQIIDADQNTLGDEMTQVPIERLIPYINNARTHSPEQIKKLRASLREFGFVNPILIDRNYNVIAGHGRLVAAREEGFAGVPCVYVDHLTETQKKAYILADNRMAMDAGWDEELLKVELESLQEISSKANEVWNGVTSFFSTTWNNIKSGATIGWNNIKSGIEGTWNTLKSNASTAWNNITNAVSTAITNAKAGIVNGWNNIKNGVKGAWDSVLGVIKSPIESAKTWLQEKVNYFKGLFNFQWKLPEFKLPRISVTWNDIGWGIKLPKLSVSWNALGGIFDKPTILGSAAGLQGVGEAGAEAILPLDTLWTEMSARLKAGMIDVMSGFMGERSTENMESLLRDLIDAVRANNGETETVPAVNVENMVMANDMDAQSLAAQISAMTRRRQHGYGY